MMPVAISSSSGSDWVDFRLETFTAAGMVGTAPCQAIRIANGSEPLQFSPSASGHDLVGVSQVGLGMPLANGVIRGRSPPCFWSTRMAGSPARMPAGPHVRGAVGMQGWRRKCDRKRRDAIMKGPNTR